MVKNSVNLAKMSILLNFLIAAILLTAAPSGASSACSIDGNYYYSIDANSNSLHIIDSSDGHTVSTRTLSLPDNYINYGHGLTIKPGTCELFAILSIGNTEPRMLAKINPVSGAVTLIGELMDDPDADTEFPYALDFDGLAFNSDGTLYGVALKLGKTELFTIDINNAVTNKITELDPDGLSDGGAGSIAFKDGLIYHASGQNNIVFESIDPSSNTITNILLSEDNPVLPYGIQAIANFKDNKILLADENGELFSITTDGIVEDIGSMDYNSKGLAPPCTAYSFLSDQDLYYSIDGSSDQLFVINSLDGHTVSSTTITLSDFPDEYVDGGNGLSHKPGTCELFAVLRTSLSSERQLAIINPITGAAILIGGLGDNFAGLAFDSAGTLYGVTGNGANQPSMFFTIDTSDATTEKIELDPIDSGDGGEAIAFKNGLIYHAFGTSTNYFESIDPVTLTRTPIDLTGDGYYGIRTLANFKDNKLLLVAQDNELYSITIEGFVEDINSIGHPSKGMVPPVPELSTLALSTIGIIGLVLMTRKTVK